MCECTAVQPAEGKTEGGPMGGGGGGFRGWPPHPDRFQRDVRPRGCRGETVPWGDRPATSAPAPSHAGSAARREERGPRGGGGGGGGGGVGILRHHAGATPRSWAGLHNSYNSGNSTEDESKRRLGFISSLIAAPGTGRNAPPPGVPPRPVPGAASRPARPADTHLLLRWPPVPGGVFPLAFPEGWGRRWRRQQLRRRAHGSPPPRHTLPPPTPPRPPLPPGLGRRRDRHGVPGSGGRAGSGGAAPGTGPAAGVWGPGGGREGGCGWRGPPQAAAAEGLRPQDRLLRIKATPSPIQKNHTNPPKPTHFATFY